MFRFILILHLLGACIWVGGHLVLLFTILPKALREGDPGAVLRFEHGYERIGIPALLIQAVTGIWLAARYVPGIWPAFTFDDPLRSAVAIKLTLLFATLLTGLHARLRIIPRLVPERMSLLFVHVALVTIMAVAMLVVGAFIRTGA
ncbi:MAG: copper resistance protein CopD [Flavobacteriales bacterium]|jgi:putative copper export protein|nr:MAG: copper resistance protein CopD [Flavobacteriales bacterium]